MQTVKPEPTQADATNSAAAITRIANNDVRIQNICRERGAASAFSLPSSSSHMPPGSTGESASGHVRQRLEPCQFLRAAIAAR